MTEEPRHRATASTPETAARRAKTIVASLRAGEPSSHEVLDAFWHLDALPVEAVRDALAPWVGTLPDLDRPLRLRAISIAKDADLLDLGPIAEEQIRLAGRSWDGVDLAPEERLDGELEGSFAGTLERRVLADADAGAGEVPLFDVLLFGEDSGIVFAAGTTKVIAFVAYRKVETRDQKIRVGIEQALAERVEAEAEAEAKPVRRVRPTKAKTEAKAEKAVEKAVEKKAAKKPAKKAAKKISVKTATKKAAAPKKTAKTTKATKTTKAKVVKKTAARATTKKKR